MYLKKPIDFVPDYCILQVHLKSDILKHELAKI